MFLLFISEEHGADAEPWDTSMGTMHPPTPIQKDLVISRIGRGLWMLLGIPPQQTMMLGYLTMLSKPAALSLLQKQFEQPAEDSIIVQLRSSNPMTHPARLMGVALAITRSFLNVN